MPRVSVMMPSRNEDYLGPTVADVLAHATGDIEVIVVLDGWWPAKPAMDVLNSDPRVRVLHWGAPRGLRPSLNAAAAMATGEFLFKLDAHCALAHGWDELLTKHCEASDIVVPEKFSLEPDQWVKFREPWHYFYLTWPWAEGSKLPWGMHEVAYGPNTNAKRAHIPVDDILTFQGSAWMLRKDYWQRLGEMDTDRYYYAHEAVELGLKAWLGGGRVRIVKSCWYAHLYKGKAHKRQFIRQKLRWNEAIARSTTYWLTNQWEDRIHDFAWVVEKFGPLPGWPANWQEEVERRLQWA
jgi:glycosyltransferase involved in cell wall biosynthesis